MSEHSSPTGQPTPLEREQALEIERLRNALYRVRQVEGHNHSTACSIWGDDGQGMTREGWTRLPCNCGALINWAREKAERLTRERDEAREALARIANATVHPDNAEIMPAAMSHMKVSHFAEWAQNVARRVLSPEPTARP